MDGRERALDYRRRVQRVVDLVLQAPGLPHTLTSLAEAACFSPYHFHRVFKMTTGESLGRFVQRARVQRAALELRSRPSATVTEIAFDVGYESTDGLRRGFQSLFGMSPKQWDRVSPLQERDIAQPGFSFPSLSKPELERMGVDHSWSVELVRIPAQRLASIAIADAFNNTEAVIEACDRIEAWVRETHPGQRDAPLYGISWDDPDITPVDRCTFEWATVIHERESGHLPPWLHERCEPELTVAQIYLCGDLNQEDAIWQYLYKVWLPGSRYEPALSPAREIYRTYPSITGWERLDLWCALPVSPLGTG